MKRRTLAVLCVAAWSAGLTAACTSSKAPAAPTAPAPSSTSSADGATLKVSTPNPVSPVNDALLDQLNQTVTLTATSVSSTYGSPTAAVQYDFELYDPSNTKISTQVMPGPTWNIPIGLQAKTRYTWRVRGAVPASNAYGAWSALASFVTPDNTGYLRGNEVYDPLINGQTVGRVVGPVTFLPGQGARLEDVTSQIVYQLPQTLTEGEFSVITTGVHHNDPALDKPKIICMSQAFDDIITNERRFTFDKRGDGTIGWRFITHGGEVDTGPDQRKAYSFNFQLTYFWRFTWRAGVATATVMEGPAGGNGQDHIVYQVSNPYKLAYDPNPHIVFLGCPIGRSGAGSASIPGVIIRQAWVSPNPRPASTNQ